MAMQKLHLVDCKFGPSGAESLFNFMSSNGSITDLKVDRNRLRTKNMVCSVFSLTSFFEFNCIVKKLTMTHCDLGDNGLQLIANGLAKNSTLAHLDLSNNDISCASIKDLSKAYKNGRLRLELLNLSNNKIEDEGAMALAHSLRYLELKQRLLKELNLSNNLVGADGAFYLGEQLRFNPQLTVLCLLQNQSLPRTLMEQIKEQLRLN